MKKTIYLLLFLSILSACTRDDICIPEIPKTPLLIVRFYNAQNPETFKATTNFTIIKEGEEFPFFNPVSVDSIAIPLATSENFTNYFFVNNSTETVPEINFISFNYTRANEFISRACSFRTNFNDFSLILDTTSSTNWIESIVILTDSINARNQHAAHIKIYH
ncbi:MAG: hypothetical protein CVU03_05765 [Bacteroidetes bacterium HGW-Bacteroidetes-2]|jgi:hypothetical protein|nr:MAG: hypothetical protein CVU03_05765 [Bacteroidetes bacterium HGW-Bacteroidetes-2]